METQPPLRSGAMSASQSAPDSRSVIGRRRSIREPISGSAASKLPGSCATAQLLSRSEARVSVEAEYQTWSPRSPREPNQAACRAADGDLAYEIALAGARRSPRSSRLSGPARSADSNRPPRPDRSASDTRRRRRRNSADRRDVRPSPSAGHPRRPASPARSAASPCNRRPQFQPPWPPRTQRELPSPETSPPGGRSCANSASRRFSSGCEGYFGGQIAPRPLVRFSPR